MDILEVDKAGEQWRTRVAPTCWYSAEVGWTASICAAHQCMPTDTAVGPVLLMECNDQMSAYHQHTNGDNAHYRQQQH